MNKVKEKHIPEHNEPCACDKFKCRYHGSLEKVQLTVDETKKLKILMFEKTIAYEKIGYIWDGDKWVKKEDE